MKLVYRCMSDPNHLFQGKQLDGVNCPICKGPVNQTPFEFEKHGFLPEYKDLMKQKSISEAKPNEIEIIMTSVNEPPKIKLNGKDIKGIVSLDYKYATSGSDAKGYHNFMVHYCDSETNTLRAVSAHKIWEG